jgi:hypothetical protein
MEKTMIFDAKTPKYCFFKISPCKMLCTIVRLHFNKIMKHHHMVLCTALQISYTTLFLAALMGQMSIKHLNKSTIQNCRSRPFDKMQEPLHNSSQSLAHLHI